MKFLKLFSRFEREEYVIKKIVFFKQYFATKAFEDLR